MVEEESVEEESRKSDEGWRFDWDAVLPGVEEEVEGIEAVEEDQVGLEQEEGRARFEIYEDPIEEC